MLVNIEAERGRNQMTKEEMAQKLGVTTKTYNNWITETTDIPSTALIAMRRIFNVSIDYLLAAGMMKRK